MPVQIDIYASGSIFVPNEVYIVLAVRNNKTCSGISKDAPPNLTSILYSIDQNIQANSYKTSVVSGKSVKDDARYVIFTFFGKFSTNQMQMAALAYAFKLG